MRILVACEESQAVTIEMRRLGHEAYSCDIQDCSGGHPEWHIKGDALALINGNCRFQTMDGVWHEIEGPWDMLIAHPPCTFLSNAGACRLYPRKGQIDLDRYAKGLAAKAFFMAFYNADCPRIAVENPLPSSVFELPPLHNGYIRIKCNAMTKGLHTHIRSAQVCGLLGLIRWCLQVRVLSPSGRMCQAELAEKTGASTVRQNGEKTQRTEPRPSPVSPAQWLNNGQEFANWILRGQSNRDKMISWIRGRRETASLFPCQYWCCCARVDDIHLCPMGFMARDLSSGMAGPGGATSKRRSSMEINVLGTVYKVNRYANKDKPIFEKRSFDGYCDPVEKEIAIVDLTTHPDFEDESEEYCRKSERMTLRHEIVHAFFNECGLMDSSLQYSGGWAKNEEMVDWIASQFNKIMECFKAAGCL